MAQAPFNYVIGQPDADSYFESVRAGRQDRLAVENDQKMNALAKYLPGALQGDKADQDMALRSAPVDQMGGLSQFFATKNAQQLAQIKEFRAQNAAAAYAIKDPGQWAAYQERQRAEAQRLGIPFADVPFEQKDDLILMGRTVDQLIDEEWKRKNYDLQRGQLAESSRHNRAVETRGGGAGGGNAPQGYQWVRGADGSVSLSPIQGGPADPNRIAPGEGVKVRASNAQLDALEQSLTGYLADLDKTTPVGRVLTRGPEVSKVETGHTDLLMQMKNLYELGVLNGPDYFLMTKMVEDPTSLLQIARGTDGLKAQADTIKSIIARSRNINNAKLGLPPTASTTPKPPQATPAARPTIPPPPGAIEMLRSNPNMAQDFDRKYGPGSAAKVLGGQ